MGCRGTLYFLSNVPVKIKLLQKIPCSPAQCGSVGWALSCRWKGRRFGSWSGHRPGFRARSPVRGVRKTTD